MLGLTIVDLALIAVALLSALLAMYRGLTRELLSISSWIVAGGVAAYFFAFHKKFAEELALQMSAPTLVAQVAVSIVLFLIVLIIVHLITSRISDAILDSRIGMIDRIFGFLFGAVRGFVIVLIPYMGYQIFVPEPSQQYDFIRQARSREMLTYWDKALRPMVFQLWEKIDNKREQKGFIQRPGGVTLAFRAEYHISVASGPGRG